MVSVGAVRHLRGVATLYHTATVVGQQRTRPILFFLLTRLFFGGVADGGKERPPPRSAEHESARHTVLVASVASLLQHLHGLLLTSGAVRPRAVRAHARVLNARRALVLIAVALTRLLALGARHLVVICNFCNNRLLELKQIKRLMRRTRRATSAHVAAGLCGTGVGR